MILAQKGTNLKMTEDDEDCNGLDMTILKSLANFFKIHERDVAPLNRGSTVVNLRAASMRL